MADTKYAWGNTAPPPKGDKLQIILEISSFEMCKSKLEKNEYIGSDKERSRKNHFQSCHRHWLSDIRVHQNSWKGLLKTRLLGPTLELKGLGEGRDYVVLTCSQMKFMEPT